MSKIAFIVGDNYIFWTSIILAFSALTAILIFIPIYRRGKGSAAAACIFIPLAVVLSIFFSRAIHWYCRFETYSGFAAAITDYRGGGFALLGAFAGCFLAAVIVSVIRLEKNVFKILDSVAPAAAFGIALGRLASIFDSSDRGMLLERFKSLPLVSAVNNPVTGVPEYRLATFLIQAIVAALIGLWLLYLIGKQKNPAKIGSGDAFFLFISSYGASQIVLDSTRYDSLFLRSNGFISIVQIAGAISVVFVLVYFAITLWRSSGFKASHILWILIAAALMGGTGYMEYYVQRHGDRALFSYSIMTACLFGLILITVFIRKNVEKKEFPTQSRET